MKPIHLLSSLTCAAVLAACASTKPAPAPPVPAKAVLLLQADNAFRLGQNEAAVATLKIATKNYPGDKAAWLRIAQISFDCHEYGEAITHARKVLELDPDDIVAHSLVAVSGLRVSSKALADLATKKRVMSGDMRAEAQNLAAVLRTSINGDIIPAKARPHAPRPAAVAPPPEKTAAQGLLDLLNQPNEPGKK